MTSAHTPSALELIERKKHGGPLSEDELRYLCQGAVEGTIPDYQLAAWLMATWFAGMSSAETLALARAMVASGTTLDWTGLDRPVVDKHSTGGVGDKTSLVLVPLIAATGLAFAKMSGRGLGHTGGTLDKLEAIPGFRVGLSLAELRSQVERIGCALVGQTPELVPADGVLYALRDATRTVDSVPLIASSVMSKKLAGGAAAIVLDVKYGAGAFMGTVQEARQLAVEMVAIGRGAGRRVRAVLSPMDRPLGRCVGNALEVREAIETLRGEGPGDLWELTRALGVQLLLLAGTYSDPDAAAAELTRVLYSGAALRRVGRLIEAQGGDPRVIDDPDRLPGARWIETIATTSDGRVCGIDPRAIAEAVLVLGGARRVKGERIDPSVGVRLLVEVGEEVRRGQAVAEIHARSEAEAEAVRERLRAAFTVVSDATALPPRPGLEIVE